MTFTLKLTIVSASLISLIFLNTSQARPKYALTAKVDYSFCHTQPFGGGQRNQYMGKAFGLRNWAPGFIPLLSVSTYVRLLFNGMPGKARDYNNESCQIFLLTR